MNQGFAVVDFETTGLSPAKGDRAIEESAWCTWLRTARSKTSMRR